MPNAALVPKLVLWHANSSITNFSDMLIDNITLLRNLAHHYEETAGGLLDRSTARYFYKQLKTSLHKPRGNLLENLFSRNYAVKNNLQLLE
jgi:hypothetical protein